MLSLFSHVSLSRVVCEAAVRFAWVLDPAVGSEVRIMRGVVLLLLSAGERLRGAMSLPPGHFNADLRQALIKNCTGEQDSTRALIERAWVKLGWSKNGKTVPPART